MPGISQTEFEQLFKETLKEQKERGQAGDKNREAWQMGLCPECGETNVTLGPLFVRDIGHTKIEVHCPDCGGSEEFNTMYDLGWLNVSSGNGF